MRSSFLPKFEPKIARIYKVFFGYDPCLFDKAEILVTFGLHFGINDDLINSFGI